MKRSIILLIITLVIAGSTSCDIGDSCLMENSLVIDIRDNSPRITIYQNDTLSIQSQQYITPNGDAIDDYYCLYVPGTGRFINTETDWINCVISDKCNEVFECNFDSDSENGCWDGGDLRVGAYSVDIIVTLKGEIVADTTVRCELHMY